MQKDSQTVFAHPAWNDRKLADITAAWHRREITVPSEWQDRRISLQIEQLNSFARVFIDGKDVGEVHFPGGELDLGAFVKPGATHVLELLVFALPLKGVMLSYTDSASARELKGSVARRGLCGDVFLLSTPAGPRLRETRARPSVRNRTCTFEAEVENLSPDSSYRLLARVLTALTK
jgi:hypothetical protein